MAKFASLPIARGTATLASASDTIATGLKVVRNVVVSFKSTPLETGHLLSADVGDQAGAPAAGSFLLKSWKTTDADALPIASTTPWGQTVDWVAFGD